VAEAGSDYSDTFRRTLRKLMDDAADRIRRPGADRLLICREALEALCQLIEADAECDLDRVSAALSKEQMPQLQLEHRAKDVQRAADRSTMIVTLITTALGEGAEGLWPALFPEQKHGQGRPVDGEYAIQRRYFGTLLEYANRLPFFRGLIEPANLIATALNRIGGAGGKRVKPQQIVDWRKQIRAAPEDDMDNITYRRLLNTWLNHTPQPQSTADAVKTLRNLVSFREQIDPRRAGEKRR
jgi:hypothetical protein